MDRTDLSDAQIEALLAEQPPVDVPAEMVDFVSVLRAEFSAAPRVATRGALAAFLEADSAAVTPTGHPRRNRMLAAVSAFVATTTGKLVLGTALAAAAVGGAHAAEVVDVPLLPDTGDVVVDDDVSSDSDDVVVEDESSDSSDSDDPAGEADNHGKTVSEFVESTELEGCEKGQAVSEVASANASDHRKNPERDHDPCSKADKDQVGDDEADTETDDGDDVEADDGSNGKSDSGQATADEAKANAPGRSGDAPGKSGDAPGKSGDAGKPDKAGKP